MATISTPEQAIKQFSDLMRDTNNPHDRGFLVNMGRAVLAGVEHLKHLVELSAGKAQKGTVTVTFSLHAFRDAKKEIRCKPTIGISSKMPSEFLKHEGEFYVGDEGELSTSPIAREQEKMFEPKVLDGGAMPEQSTEKRKGSRAI